MINLLFVSQPHAARAAVETLWSSSAVVIPIVFDIVLSIWDTFAAVALNSRNSISTLNGEVLQVDAP